MIPPAESGPDGKIPPAPGTNQIAGFVEFRPLTHWEKNNNRLLTEREGRTGEYWPEVRTLFLMVKCTSGAINLFSFLSL